MSAPSEARVVFTRDGLLRGARQAVPLVIGTFPFGLVVGIPLGVIAAVRADGLVDRLVTSVSTLLIVVPGFVLCLLLLRPHWWLLAGIGALMAGGALWISRRPEVVPVVVPDPDRHDLPPQA